MTQFLGGITGTSMQPADLFDPQYKSLSWGDAATSAAATGFDNTVLGTLKNAFSIPPRAVQPNPNAVYDPENVLNKSFAGDLLAPGAMLSPQTDTGPIIATDPKLFAAMHPTVPWEPGMTENRAQAIKDLQDKQTIRDLYMKDRPITSFLGQFIGGALSPENYVPVLGEVGAGYNVGRFGKIAIGAARSSAEAAIVTAGVDIATSPIRKELGQDTSWAAMAQDIGYGALVGAAFGGVMHTIGSIRNKSISPIENAHIESPEARAEANVIMNDAIGSVLNGTSDQIHLSPQSYSFIKQEILKVPQENIALDWHHLTVDDAGAVQRYTESYLLNDPGIKSMLEGTHVTKDNVPGQPPQIVYHGTPTAIEGRLQLDYPNNRGADLNSEKTGAIWFSDSPTHASNYAEGALFPSVYEENFNKAETAYNEAGKAAAKDKTNVELGKAYAEAKIDFQNAKAVYDNAGNQQAQRSNVVPALVDMKNPLIVDAKRKSYSPNQTMDWINEAKTNGQDGLIIKNSMDTINSDLVKPATHYATWKPDNVVNIADASARKMKETVDAKTAYMDNQSKRAALTPGYDYTKSQQTKPNIDAPTNTYGVDINKLANETNQTKVLSQATKATGMDLEARTTGQEDKFAMAIKSDQIRKNETVKTGEEANVNKALAGAEMPAELKAAMDAADKEIAKVDIIDKIMRIAAGCE